jgi:glycine oxidase
MSLLTGALLVEPRFKDAEILATFVGQRPTTPSHAPFVKSEPGRFQLNGFFRHGFLLAPALVAEVAEHFKKVI